jgi:hypothetical protein
VASVLAGWRRRRSGEMPAPLQDQRTSAANALASALSLGMPVWILGVDAYTKRMDRRRAKPRHVRRRATFHEITGSGQTDIAAAGVGRHRAETLRPVDGVALASVITSGESTRDAVDDLRLSAACPQDVRRRPTVANAAKRGKARSERV